MTTWWTKLKMKARKIASIRWQNLTATTIKNDLGGSPTRTARTILSTTSRSMPSRKSWIRVGSNIGCQAPWWTFTRAQEVIMKFRAVRRKSSCSNKMPRLPPQTRSTLSMLKYLICMKQSRCGLALVSTHTTLSSSSTSSTQDSQMLTNQSNTASRRW